ncbi:unnamed protein product, partial [Allacma fusca]
MAERTRRNVPRVNYRSLHHFGFGSDPVQEFSDDEDESLEDEEGVGHEVLGSDDEDQEDLEYLVDE